ncbi:hypothetical protein BZA77DRAFT_298522 [Pyronema omphalodes]|nr:hypothetical protein BZA77DRAFT_298522 [Pyronema omphalodes]
MLNWKRMFFILFASTVTFAVDFAGVRVGNVIDLHRERQRREEAERRVVRYRPPLSVPIQEPFSLDKYTEEH